MMNNDVAGKPSKSRGRLLAVRVQDNVGDGKDPATKKPATAGPSAPLDCIRTWNLGCPVHGTLPE
jgi:hypothetical protein